jgi:hypothetical protein
MKRFIFYACCTVMTTSLTASDTEANVAKATPSALECSKEQLMSFFPQPIVQAVLADTDLTQEQIVSIARDLSQKDQELTKRAEQKASKLNPNPFNDLSQRDLSNKIYNETLYEAFAEALKAHGITKDDQIQTLLNKMRETQSKLFIECIRKQQASVPSS